MPELDVQAATPMQAMRAVAMMGKRMNTRTQKRTHQADTPKNPPKQLC